VSVAFTQVWIHFFEATSHCVEVIKLAAGTGTIDSKFRFIILASKRARQLQAGAKPRIGSQSKRPTHIAQKEVAAGFIEYTVLAEPGRGEKPRSKRVKSKGVTKKIA
jgi:DNA-directed RNA polymerase omega subunit